MKKRTILGLIILTCCLAASATSQRRANSDTGAQASGGAAQNESTVTINNFQFSPKNLRVKVGTTVTWENKEGVHTVRADKGTFESDTLSAGQTFTYKFTKAGKYPYYCSFHGSQGGHDMAGMITVVK